ncbi:beta-N-acetylhexosaminidase [Paenibacillus hexagrammi]|uniref:Beta-N-acetylhexosaminidase n=1 Tax=Paenibacillus hexagrammi TaxID=2908839 RepID=A0ABY3SF74_9BACL|nr:beta-N-acetylhexosaminidase [Paenibacillus sp. YPD9-1]UJF32115.1 beta-N-acetylhexosaminidase [Paenibacillus sp. YPD9-1]
MMRPLGLMLYAALVTAALTGCVHQSGGSEPAASPHTAAPSPAVSSAPGPTGAAPSGPSASPVDPIADQVEAMTLSQKIGQMLIAGIDGTEDSEQTRRLIQSDRIGGIIFYKNNIQNTVQFVQLVNALKRDNEGNPVPLWLSVDEEGGRVTRLPDELQKTPSNQVIGQMNRPQLAYDIGSLLGKELKAFGLNMDFAPVLDINSNPKNPVIGDRSFGNNASIVTKLGIQAMKGLQAEQVIPVVKHFPGHGDTSVDSHVGLPVVLNSLDRLRKLEFVPFAEAVKEKADAVMVAHILLPKVDADYPASMSGKIMTDLLRKEMGFEGVIMTDDMTMGAIVKNYTIGEAAVQAVSAGANVIMVGHEYSNVETVVQELTRAVEDKRISMNAIDESVTRIIRLKDRYHLEDQQIAVPKVSELNAQVKVILKKK